MDNNNPQPNSNHSEWEPESPEPEASPPGDQETRGKVSPNTLEEGKSASIESLDEIFPPSPEDSHQPEKPLQPEGIFTPRIPNSYECNWATLAHLSGLLNLFTGFFGILVSLGIYLYFSNRSRYVAYQALQSFLIQLLGWGLAGLAAAILWGLTGAFLIILIGCLLAPIAILVSLIPPATIIYQVIAATQTGQGKDFRYWLVGDWIRNTYNEKI